MFLLGLEEGVLPHSRSMDSPEEIEEETPPLLRGYDPVQGAFVYAAGISPGSYMAGRTWGIQIPSRDPQRSYSFSR